MTAQEIIEKIRVEVRNRIQQIKDAIEEEFGTETGTYLSGKKIALEEFDFFLAYFEKECEKSTSIDFEQELYKHFGQVKDFTLGMQIGKYFYELGKQSKQPVKTNIVEDLKYYLATTQKEQIEKDWESLKEWGKVGPSVSEFLGWEKSVSEGLEEEIDACWQNWLSPSNQKEVEGVLPKSEFAFYARHFYELGRQSKPTTAEGLEEEIERYLHSLGVGYGGWVDGMEVDDLRGIARHFARWGAEHAKEQSKPKVSDGLETEALRSAGVLLSEHFEDEDDDAIRTTALRCWKGGVIHGASWQKEQMMIQWTGNNLKEVIEFTGKSPRFDEWFKTWDDYEDYVRQHGNIFKMFNDDGSHLEVPVGAWIVKTPDKRCVASKFTLKQPESEKIAAAYQLGLVDKEKQMLKEAVEGKVFMSFAPGCNQRVVSTQDVDLPCETKVKLIIIKED